MHEKEKAFKRQLFGGFDKRDVIAYIEKLAAERNRYRADEARLDAECENLRGDLEKLQAELDNADACIREIGGDAFDAAAKNFTSAGDRYRAVKESVLQTTDSIRAELRRLESTLYIMSSTLELASGRFEKLRRDFAPDDAIPTI